MSDNRSGGAEGVGGVAAVERALTVLAVFADRDDALTLAQIAQRSGLYKSTILRLIESLERFGYIRRLPDGRYHIGPEPMRLANLYQQSFRLADVVVPVLKQLAAQCGVTASFYVLDGNMRVCLHRVEPSSIVRVSLHEGDRLPLDRGAGGKVLRAFSGAKGELFDSVRKTCCATSFGERDPQTAAIAAPVFGVTQTLRGVLNFSGLREQFTPKHVTKLRRHILAAAAALTQALGGDASMFSTRASTDRMAA
ncbi:MAG TPA: IclR family transcriptional regulator [Burkholderiales bacterium]|nr:IclR family transcriptional regulator [Burkholderiales bacterium]